eukprot:6197707-Pleurochrysis_carterae.AAC.1
MNASCTSRQTSTLARKEGQPRRKATASRCVCGALRARKPPRKHNAKRPRGGLHLVARAFAEVTISGMTPS